MDKKEIILSKEGYAELESKLDYLRTVKRGEIAEKIKTAREFGDLSENAEYEEAKQEQGFIEGEIHELEYKLKNAIVFDENEVPTDVVSVGNKVKVFDGEFKEEVTYTIVGSEEVDLAAGKISNESPIGSALLMGKVGDVVQVKVPDGVVDLKILEIC